VYWGNDGFCVDVALHAPGDREPSAGVLCDSSRFTGAQDPVEWDVFRTGMLEAMGWKLERVWSPQVYRDLESTVATLGGKLAL
jgi:hypothetical protein